MAEGREKTRATQARRAERELQRTLLGQRVIGEATDNNGLSPIERQTKGGVNRRTLPLARD